MYFLRNIFSCRSVKIPPLFINALREIFSPYPYRIIQKEIDALTKKAIFIIKTKRAPVLKQLFTKDIMEENYFDGLSPKDRKKVKDQYILELQYPSAYIEEYPLKFDGIFKIILLEEKKIVCGKPSYFVKNKEILSKLNHKDVATLGKYFAQEMAESEIINQGQPWIQTNNIRVLR